MEPNNSAHYGVIYPPTGFLRCFIQRDWVSNHSASILYSAFSLHVKRCGHWLLWLMETGWTTRVEPYFWFLHFLISSWYQVVFKLQSLTQYLDYPLFLTYRLGFGKYYTRIFFWQNISFQKKLISNVISIWGEICNEVSWIENAPKYPNIHPIWCAETSVRGPIREILLSAFVISFYPSSLITIKQRFCEKHFKITLYIYLCNCEGGHLHWPLTYINRSNDLFLQTVQHRPGLNTKYIQYNYITLHSSILNKNRFCNPWPIRYVWILKVLMVGG